MRILLDALTAFIALQHFGFFVLEAILWTKPTGRKVFQLTPERAEDTKQLAQNQGLYNTFLAAGLIWALVVRDAPHGPSVRLFFLACVAVAGIFGGITVKKSIFFLQGVPALIGLELALAG